MAENLYEMNVSSGDGLNISDKFQNSTDTRIPELIIEGVLLPALSIPGIIGNILCVWIFHKKDVELKPSFANLLKCLSVFDTLFLIGLVIQYCLPIYSEYFAVQITPRITPYSLPLLHMSLTGSVYSVVSLALERFITVCFPFHNCKMYNGLVYITFITIFSILYNINKTLELEIEFEDYNVTTINEYGENVTEIMWKPWVVPTEMRQSEMYSLYVVFLLNFIVLGLFPVILLSVLNFLIYRSIHKATRNHNNISSDTRRDTAMAGLLTAIVVVFLACHCPKVAVNLYEVLQGKEEHEYPLWLVLLVKINHLLLALNSAANIIIYSYKDIRFRKAVIAGFKRTKTLSSLRTSFKTSFGSRYRTRHLEVTSPEPVRVAAGGKLLKSAENSQDGGRIQGNAPSASTIDSRDGGSGVRRGSNRPAQSNSTMSSRDGGEGRRGGSRATPSVSTASSSRECGNGIQKASTSSSSTTADNMIGVERNIIDINIHKRMRMSAGEILYEDSYGHWTLDN